jgi:RHS repeat-associated protein
VTTTGPSRLVLAFYANKKPATYSNYTAPAVERFDVPNVPGGLPSNALASYTLAAAGASGAKSATPSEAAEWVAQQLAIAPGQSVTSFLWDVNRGLPQLGLERDASGAPVRRYVYGLARIRQSVGTASYYHADGLGSVVNLTSDTGAAQRTLSYEPFGQVRTNTGSGPASALKFAGEYEDGNGFYHLRARQYDPSTGRFLSRDPIPSVGSAYAYAGNNPLAFVDPSGHQFGPLGEAWRRVDSRTRAFVQGVGEAIGDAVGHGHTALAVGGAVPYFGEPADAVNAAWYLAEGNYTNASISGASIIPGIGAAALAARLSRSARAADAADGGVTLYRAVGDDELADIASIGMYRIAGRSAQSGKYFYPTAQQAHALWHAAGHRP